MATGHGDRDMASSTEAATSDIRVWAEERAPGEILLTWQWPETSGSERDAAADARAIAATVVVLKGVTSAEPTPDGVRVRFDTDAVTRAQIAAALRAALAQEGDLKTRANDLMKRAPDYANLARSLALDERVSPMPEVARQAASRRSGAAGATALRMIPGVPLVSQLYSLLPMLRALGSWSREASPEVVDEHLAAVGLTREVLDRDLATTHEAMLLVKEHTAGAASKAAAKATTAATQARDAAREWVDRRGQPPEPRQYEP
jgi:hypothetical protein